jgi:hypothetical protein
MGVGVVDAGLGGEGQAGIGAVAAMLSTAVIQKRIRRVVVASLIRLHPAVPGSAVLRGRGRGI